MLNENFKTFVDNIQRTYKFVKPYLGLTLISIFTSQIYSLINLGIPILIKYLVDEILIKNNWEKFHYFAIIFILAVIVSEGLSLFSSYSYAKTSENIYAFGRTKLFNKFLSKNIIFFNKNKDGDLANRLMNDSGYLHTTIAFILSQLIISIIKILVTFVILLIINVKFALITMFTVPVFLCLNAKYGTKVKNLVTKSRDLSSKLNNFYIDTFHNIKHIKNYNSEDVESKAHEDLSNDIAKVHTDTEYAGYLAHSLISIFTRLNQILILCIGAIEVKNGFLTVGGIIAFNSYLPLIYEPFLTLTNVYRIFSQTNVYLNRYFEFYDDKDIEYNNFSPIGIKVGGDIEFCNVGFAYNENRQILNKFSFVIEKGDKVNLKGISGRGKTTIFNLLKKFYLVDEGEIYIGSKDINSIELPDLRREILYISQDNYFFPGTVRDNFKRLSQNITDDEILKVLNLVDIKVVDNELSAFLDLDISKNAAKLSGGQKQKIKLSSIFILDRDIILLDEPFTGIDNSSTKIIWNNIKQKLDEKTVLFIDHNFDEEDYFDKYIII